jgi:membrane protein
MTTYAAALAYRGLFGLFPFVLIVIVLAGMLGFPGSFDRLLDQGQPETAPQVPRQLEPVVEEGRKQITPLGRMIEQAQEQAGSGLLFFGIAVGLWSVSALARTLADALNAVNEVTETRQEWKRVEEGRNSSFISPGPLL